MYWNKFVIFQELISVFKQRSNFNKQAFGLNLFSEREKKIFNTTPSQNTDKLCPQAYGTDLYIERFTHLWTYPLTAFGSYKTMIASLYRRSEGRTENLLKSRCIECGMKYGLSYTVTGYFIG